MKKLPAVTFYTDLHLLDDALRRCYLNELAACGAKQLVHTSSMLRAVMGNHDLGKKYAADVAAAGLSWCDSHALFGPDWDLNTLRQHDMVICGHKLAMNIVAQRGIKTMTFHIGNDFIYPEIPEEKHFERIYRSLDELLPEAEKLDLVIAIENSWTKLASPENLLKIKAHYDTGYLGICYDSGHANIMDNGRLYPQGPAYDTWQAMQIKTPVWEDAALEKMLNDTVVCHLHDNDGTGDYHNLPGRGNIDWNKTMKLLENAPRLMSLQSEVAVARHGISCKELVETFADMCKKGGKNK